MQEPLTAHTDWRDLHKFGDSPTTYCGRPTKVPLGEWMKPPDCVRSPGVFISSRVL
jgi:hypothetical protein